MGIGRLRGVPRRRWLASVYVEPGLVLLAGLPLGYPLGAEIASMAVERHLGPNTPVELARWPVLAVAALTVGGALAALVGVSVRSIRRPLSELISQSTEPRRLTVLGAVAQTAVVLLAAASLYQLLAGGALVRERSLLGLLAPALFALALAVLAVRAAVLVVRRVTTRPPRSLAALVVGRQTARTPSTLNPAVVLATGLALAIFAGQVLALANRNADLRAAAITGADQVLGVTAPPGADLVEIVRAADPSGQWAMAAQERQGGSVSGTGRIVAVDSTRLAAVAAWTPQWAEVADLTAALRSTTSAPIELRGRTVEITLARATVISSAGVNPGSGTVDPNARGPCPRCSSRWTPDGPGPRSRSGRSTGGRLGWPERSPAPEAVDWSASACPRRSARPTTRPSRSPAFAPIDSRPRRRRPGSPNRSAGGRWSADGRVWRSPTPPTRRRRPMD